MKHKITASFLALVALTALCAPTAKADDNNRIAVYYGDALYLQAAAVIGFDFGTLGTFKFENCPGAFGINYHHVSDSQRWAFGADVNFTPLKIKSTIDNSILDASMLGIFPSVQCYYIKKGIVRLYGEVQAGVMLGMTDGEVGVGFGGQFNPLGLRVGSNKIAGFASVGFGTKGIFNVGLQIGF